MKPSTYSKPITILGKKAVGSKMEANKVIVRASRDGQDVVALS
jgi:hypothetical protein